VFLSNPPDFDKIQAKKKVIAEDIKTKELNQSSQKDLEEKSESTKPVDEDNISVYLDKSEEEMIKENEKFNLFNDIYSILSEKIFMFCLISICIIYFVSTSISYWTTDYLLTVLNVEQYVANILFVLTCISSPTLGVIIGGIVISKAGGYESKYCLIICSIISVLACSCSFPIAFTNSVFVFGVFLWLFLFFGGCIIPNLIGAIISSLSNTQRASGNSLTNLMTNLLGYIPSPFIYGIINDATKAQNPKTAYSFTVLYVWTAMLFLPVATYLRYKIYLEKLGQSEKDEREIKLDGVSIKSEIKSDVNSNSFKLLY